MAHSIRTSILTILAVLLLCIPAFALDNPFSGQVVGVIDGDTIDVLVDRSPVRVRLHGIDCPEKSAPFGNQAKKFASDLAFKKTVTVQVTDIDRYGRTVGEVILPDGSSLNRELVKAGYAWWYRKYAPDDKELEALEGTARTSQRGLWADPNPISLHGSGGEGLGHLQNINLNNPDLLPRWRMAILSSTSPKRGRSITGMGVGI